MVQGHTVRRPSSKLGRYSLNDADTLEAQYQAASSFGVTGFSVWHYWFGGGKKLLERPLDIILRKELDFRYALAWANHSWTDKSNGRLLMEQKYLGQRDYEAFFFDTIGHLQSRNYIKIEGRPVFSIYDPVAIPDIDLFMGTWNELAVREGLEGIFWIGDKLSSAHPLAAKFDRVSNGFGFWSNRKKLYWNWIKEKLRTKLSLSIAPLKFDYSMMVFDSIPEWESAKFIPTIIAGWDTTPRHSRRGVVFNGYNPESFSRHLDTAYEFFAEKKPPAPIILVKSWNEWAEGNALEADNVHGTSLQCGKA